MNYLLSFLEGIRIKKVLFVSTFVFFVLNFYAQESIQLSLKWLEPELLVEYGRSYDLPRIEGQQLDGNKPNYFFKQAVPHLASFPVFEVLATQPALRKESIYLKSQFIEVPESPTYKIKVTREGKETFLVMDLFPFVLQNGIVHRILDVKIDLKPLPSSASAKKLDYVANSALRNGTGEWYKISVDKDGIYKIDKAFLESLGIDVSTLNPQHLNIFGNGDGLLPESNAAPRTDDLAKNAILVAGEGDGVFDDNDYILFYGWGPHRWNPDGTGGFEQTRHIYSDISCYFININAAETPNRIATESSTADLSTHVVTDYNYFSIHENDLLSLVKGGQRWYGELFDTQLERVFGFSIPDVISSYPASFKVALASDAKNFVGTAQTYKVNGATIFDTTLPTGVEFARSTNSMTLSNPSSYIPFTISITRNSPNVLTYLDYISLNARREIKHPSAQFNFRDWLSTGAGNVAEFTVESISSNGFVWDVTNRHEPKLINGVFSGSDFVFRLHSDSLREFVGSNGSDFFTPKKIAAVQSQNLHALPQADYLIVTHKNFYTQAERLANLHRNNGLTVHVVKVDEIYNEFSSGMQDATAIRLFCKMFWDRGEIVPDSRPKHLLLFGDGTYDPKNRVANNNNYILTYQMITSENHIDAMPSDDYFGILDDAEEMSSVDLVDLGVGRLLISDLQMAKEQVDKIEHYMKNGSELFPSADADCCTSSGSAKTFGDWRTKYVQIADDEETNYFLKYDVEPQYEYVRDSFPEMNCEKIYLDAYKQELTAGGPRYPDVNDAIDRAINRGALLINYVGHGGEVGVAEERVITVPMIQSWRNINKMPLMVTATCEFTKFDDPDRVSAGEWASINPEGAAIALMTTTRSVYFTTNTFIGLAFFKNVFKRETGHVSPTFGNIITNTKNAVGGDNKRSFLLIGDPALRLALPSLTVVTDSINGKNPQVVSDTIRALSKVTVKGHLEDYLGNKLSTFNGIVYPTVYDKPKEQKTLSNDGAASPERIFYTQNSKVYSGKATVTNGDFEFTFIVPKDINYSIDFGKISYYAENGQADAIGFDSLFYIGGIDPAGLNDATGPEMELYLNNESFVDGGITDENPILLVKLFDENGINTTGSGIGHDLVAVLDDDHTKPIKLNDFYSSDIDSYQSGEIRYNLLGLSPGEHTLNVKVWDVNNNSSESVLRFTVKEKAQLSLEHVLNYPNPFTTRTEFFFEHNQVCNFMEVQIQVFTVSGRLVKTINQLVQTEGYRSAGIEWDGRDDFGDQLARGVYIYRLTARSEEGTKAEKIEKLVILK